MSNVISEELGPVKIRKRDGRIIGFSQERITEAIWKAAQSIGGRDRSVAAQLSIHVKLILQSKYKPDDVPSVEEVQDVVERVLIENDHAKTAKSYILYRQKRAVIREEKMRILEKDDIDEVDKIFDVNSLRVLKARYLRKNEKGKLTESPKELFTRIAIHVTIPNLFYDDRVYDISGNQSEQSLGDFVIEEWEGKLSIGEYYLNRYHLDAIRRLYTRFGLEGKMKVSWARFLEMLQAGEFKDHDVEVREFYDLMVNKLFMPNTPAIANFGNPLGMGSACFVLGIEDNMESIMETLKDTAIVFKAGGGMGYNFSNLRPEGDYVSTTSGVASGPISFMRLFDTMTEVVKQGGIRRGANMGILNINHPDIEKFITAKSGNKGLRNFNISVLITTDFWEHYEKNEPFPLVNPRNNDVVRTVNPRMLFDMIIYQAWESAEPGVIFSDHVNNHNPTYKSLGPIVTTNPCGEVLLYPNESCNLGSVNVWAFVKSDSDGKITYDWNGLAEATRIATRFLDNIIDVNNFPLKDIEEMTLATRKIGVGIMGLGDLLYALRIPYNSDEGLQFMSKLMEFVNYHTKVISIELARDRGSFPYYDKSFYTENRLPFSGFDERSSWNFDWDKIAEDAGKQGMRNAYTTVIAPTGSISMIAGCSSGMEPVYSMIFQKNVKVGSFYYIDPVFEDAMRAEGLHDDKLVEAVAENRGSIQNIPYIHPDLKKVFVTAHDVTPKDHIKALATFQKWVDSSISKTNNFPADASVDDMRESYLLAYKLGCKDITVFRDTSIKEQVLVSPGKAPEEKKEQESTQTLTHDAEESIPTIPHLSPTTIHNTRDSYVTETTQIGGIQAPPKEIARTGTVMEYRSCPQCSTSLIYSEGCLLCPACGWGLCS